MGEQQASVREPLFGVGAIRKQSMQMGDFDSEMICPNCGTVAVRNASFCGRCGSSLDAEQTSIDHVVATVEGVLIRHGSLTLANRLFYKVPPRLEITAEEQGSFDPDDRQRLIDMLEETLQEDGYLYAEILRNQEPAGCLWHVINGFVIPLTSEHAGAVLGLYPELLPAEGRQKLIDAPELTWETQATLEDEGEPGDQ